MQFITFSGGTKICWPELPSRLVPWRRDCITSKEACRVDLETPISKAASANSKEASEPLSYIALSRAVSDLAAADIDITTLRSKMVPGDRYWVPFLLASGAPFRSFSILSRRLCFEGSLVHFGSRICFFDCFG